MDLALMDGQFWEEAIQQLSMAAGLGCQRLKCWELWGLRLQAREVEGRIPLL